MVKLDVVKAAFSGFGVIGRNPLSVIVWALFIGVLGVLPIAILLGGMTGPILELIRNARQDIDPSEETIRPLIFAGLALLPVMMLTGLVARTLLSGAVFRAMLFPEDKGWFYLRLSARELWLALVYIVIGILGFFIAVGVMAVLLPMMLLTSGLDNEIIQDAVVQLMFLPVYALVIFLVARFGLALPMTFAESRFRLFESWNLTRGNGWRIVFVLLLLVALSFAVQMVVSMIILIIVLGVVLALIGNAPAGAWDPERIEAALEALVLQDPTVWISQALPWIALWLVVASIISTLIAVIFIAPLAEAYRQLKARPEPAL